VLVLEQVVQQVLQQVLQDAILLAAHRRPTLRLHRPLLPHHSRPPPESPPAQKKKIKNPFLEHKKAGNVMESDRLLRVRLGGSDVQSVALIQQPVVLRAIAVLDTLCGPL
jgi:hypothetical protein